MARNYSLGDLFGLLPEFGSDEFYRTPRSNSTATLGITVDDHILYALSSRYNDPVSVNSYDANIVISDLVPGIKNTEVSASYSGGKVVVTAKPTYTEDITSLLTDRFSINDGKVAYELIIDLDSLSTEIDIASISVSVHEGLLKVVLPRKVEKVTSKKIKVTGATE